MKTKYACPECGGRGVIECPECGVPHDCEACQGCGLDPDRVDVSAYLSATGDLQAETGLTWGLIEDGEMIGRTSAVGNVRITDFLKQETQDDSVSVGE